MAVLASCTQDRVNGSFVTFATLATAATVVSKCSKPNKLLLVVLWQLDLLTGK